MSGSFEAVVIGGGQAGLATSYWLGEADVDHVVLERDRLGERWRSERWDSFTLVTPNWMADLPGFPYDGDPDGFLTRDAVVAYLEAYAAFVDPPLRCGVEATAVRAVDDGFVVETTGGTYEAATVVVATGTFQTPRIPECAVDVPPDVRQLHSSRYQNPEALPAGGVLVVGSGQSGGQIAQELHEAGREVYLSASGAPKVPRRYRGRDTVEWLVELTADQTVEDLDSPAERFGPNPTVSGKDGGRDVDLLAMADDGVTLFGRTVGVEDGQVVFADDLTASLRRMYGFETELLGGVDEYVEQAGLDVPEASYEPRDPEAIAVEADTALDLARAGVGSIVWATGYTFDFGWVEPASVDEYGYPVAERGVTDVPGLYVVGLHWLHTAGSGLLFGVGDDAEHVVADLVGRLDAASA